METNILNNSVLSTNNVIDLSITYSNFIKEIKQLISNEVYEENDDVKYKYHLTHKIIETLDPNILKESGICNIRRFKRYLKLASKTKSLHSINKFLNLVHKKIMKLDYSPKIVCEKHERIQKLRKEWLEYKKITDELLLKYKNEKGNFYKK
jgi:hypothetical protein